MVTKKIFRNGKGNIHFGIEAVRGFSEATKEDVKISLKNIGKRSLWRCTVCNDVHLGARPPKTCPTCKTINAYVKINEKEFLKIIGI